MTCWETEWSVASTNLACSIMLDVPASRQLPARVSKEVEEGHKVSIVLISVIHQQRNVT